MPEKPYDYNQIELKWFDRWQAEAKDKMVTAENLQKWIGDDDKTILQVRFRGSDQTIPLPASDPCRRCRACRIRITTSAERITRKDTALVRVPSA